MKIDHNYWDDPGSEEWKMRTFSRSFLITKAVIAVIIALIVAFALFSDNIISWLATGNNQTICIVVASVLIFVIIEFLLNRRKKRIREQELELEQPRRSSNRNDGRFQRVNSTEYDRPSSASKPASGNTFLLLILVFLVIIDVVLIFYNPNAGKPDANEVKDSVITVGYDPSRLDTKEKVIDNLLKNMVKVDGGTFMMGADKSQDTLASKMEMPVHKVTLSPFTIGKYEVTQLEWRTIMGSNPSEFKGDDRPVDRVTWDECQDFIAKLNAATKHHFRLPTEAEWEFAARGGNKGHGYRYAGSNDINKVAWYTDNSSGTHPVGLKEPNELGLYDITGNVWEWTQDWFALYADKPQTNPTVSQKVIVDGRVMKGGCFNSTSRICRITLHGWAAPDSVDLYPGLRIAE